MKTKFSTRSSLELIQILSGGTCSTDDLSKQFDCSVATTRRMIAAARQMGAEIEVQVSKNPPTYSYQLKNWRQIKPVVEKWLRQYEGIVEIEAVHAIRPNILKLPQQS